MNESWTPLWSQIVDSTLWEEEPHVRLTFLTMMALKGPDQICRMPLRRLVKKVNLEYSLVEEAVKVLESPDSKGGEHQKFDGRRVEKVYEGDEFAGWLILNGEHYQREMVKKFARMRKTELQWQRRHASKPLKGESAFLRANGDKEKEEAVLESTLPPLTENDDAVARTLSALQEEE